MRKAFTILELLVVIAIITILITISTASYSSAQKKSRDTKRKSDLKAIQSAFEQYYSINNFQYPVPASTTLSGSLTSGGVIILTYPKNPTGTDNYYTCTSCTVTSFSICADLEIDTPSNFCVQNQQ